MDVAFICTRPLAGALGAAICPATSHAAPPSLCPPPSFVSPILPVRWRRRSHIGAALLPVIDRRRREMSTTPAITMRSSDARNRPRRARRRASRSSARRSDAAGNALPLSVAQLAEGLQAYWRTSAPSTRLLAGAGGLAALTATAAALNAVVHVSFLLALAIVPLLMAPVLLTVFAGVSVFALLAVATAGAGVLFVGTPFFMVALIAKMFVPVFITVGLGAALVANALKVGGRAVRWVQRGVLYEDDDDVLFDDDAVDDDDDDDDDIAADDNDDRLAEFDRMLNRRSGLGTTAAVTAWTISNVVDELDSCGLGHYRQLFIDERIDGRTLLSLSDDDIRTEFSSMPLGDRRRLASLVAALLRRDSRM